MFGIDNCMLNIQNLTYILHFFIIVFRKFIYIVDIYIISELYADSKTGFGFYL